MHMCEEATCTTTLPQDVNDMTLQTSCHGCSPSRLRESKMSQRVAQDLHVSATVGAGLVLEGHIVSKC